MQFPTTTYLYFAEYDPIRPAEHQVGIEGGQQYRDPRQQAVEAQAQKQVPRLKPGMRGGREREYDT